MNKCANCDGERKEEEKNLYNKMYGIYMGVCKKCWDRKFEMKEVGS